MRFLLRRFFAMLFATIAFILVLPPAARAVITLITETFTTSTTSETFISGTGITASGNSLPACLTAGTGATSTVAACPKTLNPNNGANNGSIPDASGSGTLRLTDNEANQSSFVIVSTPVSTSNGITATFDLFSYGGSGADGIGFLVLDGTKAAPTTAGADGGSFGYAQKTSASCCNAPGIANGYFGIGFDEFGNYSNPTEGRIGGPGFTPQAVAIRGSAASNYNYVTGVKTPQAFSFPTSTTRPTPINVRLSVSPGGVIKVDMDFTGTSTSYQSIIPAFNITSVANQGALPASLRFGFSASTGTDTNFHEIRNFVATSNAPSLTMTKAYVGTGTFTGGQNGQYTLTVGDSSSGAATDQNVIVTDVLPTGETYVSATGGTSWSCSVAGTPPAQQTVTCLYQLASIASGATAAPITLTVAVAPNAPASITNTANANTSDNFAIAGANGSATVAVTDTPFVQVLKRVLSILTKGPTPGPQTTAHLVTYTPDPGSITGVSGTAATTTAIPGDTITYGLYFLNTGGVNAIGTTTALGPAFTDPLAAPLTYVAASQTATCCVNPTSTTALNFTQTGQTLKWVLQAPLPPATAATSTQGSITFKALVK